MEIGNGSIDNTTTWQKTAEEAVDIPLGVGAQRQTHAVDNTVLKGEGIASVTTARVAMTPKQAAELASIVGRVFESLQNIVKNIAPSKQELEVLRRRLEELKQLRHDLADRKIDEELAWKTFVNIVADEVVKKFLPEIDRKAKYVHA